MDWEDERATCGRWSGDEWLLIVALDFSLGTDIRPALSIFLTDKGKVCLSTYTQRRPRTCAHSHTSHLLAWTSGIFYSSISMATVSDDNISFYLCHSHLGLRCHRSKRWFLCNKRQKEIRLGWPWICVAFSLCLSSCFSDAHYPASFALPKCLSDCLTVIVSVVTDYPNVSLSSSLCHFVTFHMNMCNAMNVFVLRFVASRLRKRAFCPAFKCGHF